MSEEELQTINEQLRRRSQELDRTNLFLGSILSSIQSGVAVVDAELHVQIWNQKAEDLWGLRADEVAGTHLLNLDIGLPVEHLRAPLRACLAGEVSQNEIVLEATNRRGKAIQCKVTCMPHSNMMGEIQGVILIMEEKDGTHRESGPVPNPTSDLPGYGETQAPEPTVRGSREQSPSDTSRQGPKRRGRGHAKTEVVRYLCRASGSRLSAPRGVGKCARSPCRLGASACHRHGVRPSLGWQTGGAGGAHWSRRRRCHCRRGKGTALAWTE